MICRPSKLSRSLALFVTHVVALFSQSELKADDHATLTVEVQVDLSGDIGQAFGSLWEAADTEDSVFAGAGFLNAYNTQDRSDRRMLQVYIRTSSPAEFRKVLLPRPSNDAGTYLYGFDGKLFSFGRNALDKALRLWDSDNQQWQIDLATPPLAVHVEKHAMYATAQQINYGDQVILQIPQEQGRLGEWYYADGKLIVRYFSGNGSDARNELVAFPWKPEQETQLVLDSQSNLIHQTQNNQHSYLVQPLSQPGEFIYSFGQINHRDGIAILAASNQGGVHLLRDGIWRTIREPDGKSFQIYSSINFHDRILLGQYPTGNLFELVGDQLLQLVDWPPCMKGVSRNAREAQTMVLYGGDLLVGVWPWGEVWRHSSREGQWSLLGRMFSHPDLTDQVTHPYETQTKQLDPVLNRWGQRVTSMVPMGDSLYISTSAKGPNPYEPKFTFLSEDRHLEYGSVYRYHQPGCLTVPVRWSQKPTKLRFVLTNTSLHVYQDDVILGHSHWQCASSSHVESHPSIRWGQGVYGRFAGRSLVPIADPSNGASPSRNDTKESAHAKQKLNAAYLHLHRMFGADSSSDQQRELAGRELDRMRQLGINTILPFAYGSSGQAYYDSQLMPRYFVHSDPLLILSEEAQSRHIQICPVVPVMVSGGKQPSGILLQHPEWALRSPDAAPTGYFSPANQDARQHLVVVCREIVQHLKPSGMLLDYLRYTNEPHRLDKHSENRFLGSLPPDCSAEIEREMLQKFKEDELTELARQLSETIRAERPGIPVAAYVWGPHVVKNHRIAQVWPRWVELGYLDHINVSGYCHRKKYGERFLEEFRDRMQQSVELNQRLAKPAFLSFALGIKTSHGEVQSADDILAYQEIAEDLSMDGSAYFTWEYLQPFLDDLQ